MNCLLLCHLSRKMICMNVVENRLVDTVGESEDRVN